MNSWRDPCDILYHFGCLQGNDGLVKEALGYIIKVIYFVPLICYECAFGVLSETNSSGDDSVFAVRLAVCPNMKCKPIGIKSFLNPSADIFNRFAP